MCQPLSVCFIAGFSAQMLEAFLMNPIFVIRHAPIPLFRHNTHGHYRTRARTHHRTLHLISNSCVPLHYRSAHVRGHFDHVAEPVRSPPSVWQATRDLFREGGPRAFWRGYRRPTVPLWRLISRTVSAAHILRHRYWATVASGAPFISCYYAFAEMFGQMIAHRAGYASPLDLPLHLSALAGTFHSPRVRVRVRWCVACVCSLGLHRKGGCGAGLAVAITTPLEILRQRGLTEWHHWNQTKEVLLSQGFVQVTPRTTPAALHRGTWRLTEAVVGPHRR